MDGAVVLAAEAGALDFGQQVPMEARERCARSGSRGGGQNQIDVLAVLREPPGRREVVFDHAQALGVPHARPRRTRLEHPPGLLRGQT